MVRSTKRKTTEEFIAAAKEIHEEKYDYSLVEYINNRAKVQIVCNNCLKHFWKSPKDHVGKQKQGCPHCGPSSVKGTGKFINESVAVHGDKYTYDKVDYRTAKTKVIVTCPLHGDWSVTPMSHLRGNGCKVCAENKNTLAKRKSQQVFIEEVKRVHGDKYDLSKLVYTNKRTKVCLICKTHGEFYILPSNLLNGSNCGMCGGGGYSSKCPGWLYVLKSGNITKIGITNKSAQSRAKSVSKSSGKTFTVEFSLYSKDGRIAQAAEASLLSLFRSLYEPVSDSFDGYTECFIDADYEAVIESVLREFNNAQGVVK